MVAPTQTSLRNQRKSSLKSTQITNQALQFLVFGAAAQWQSSINMNNIIEPNGKKQMKMTLTLSAITITAAAFTGNEGDGASPNNIRSHR